MHRKRCTEMQTSNVLIMAHMSLCCPSRALDASTFYHMLRLLSLKRRQAAALIFCYSSM